MDKKSRMAKLYENGLSLSEIGKELSLSGRTVGYHLSNIGVKMRPRGGRKIYKFNEDFFSIPNESNSYWAGFIAADFHLREWAGKRRTYQLSCSLSVKDAILLERFLKDIGHLSGVKTRRRIRKGTELFTAEVTIYSKKMFEDLASNFNIEPGKKSNRLNPPKNLDRKNRLAFITGYIDGDGWLQYNKKGLNLGVCGTYEVVYWIKSSLENELQDMGINGNTGNIQKRRNLCTWRANIYSWALAELLSKVPVIKLERKLPQIGKHFELHKNKFTNKSKLILGMIQCRL